MGPLLLAGLAGLMVWVWWRPIPKDFQGDVFPRAYGLTFLALIAQNLIAQLVTGPRTAWNEVIFSIYYGLLFLLTAIILYYYHVMKGRSAVVTFLTATED
jgi:hypothetical protein